MGWGLLGGLGAGMAKVGEGILEAETKKDLLKQQGDQQMEIEKQKGRVETDRATALENFKNKYGESVRSQIGAVTAKVHDEVLAKNPSATQEDLAIATSNALTRAGFIKEGTEVGKLGADVSRAKTLDKREAATEDWRKSMIELQTKQYDRQMSVQESRDKHADAAATRLAARDALTNAEREWEKLSDMLKDPNVSTNPQRVADINFRLKSVEAEKGSYRSVLSGLAGVLGSGAGNQKTDPYAKPVTATSKEDFNSKVAALGSGPQPPTTIREPASGDDKITLEALQWQRKDAVRFGRTEEVAALDKHIARLGGAKATVVPEKRAGVLAESMKPSLLSGLTPEEVAAAERGMAAKNAVEETKRPIQQKFDSEKPKLTKAELVKKYTELRDALTPQQQQELDIAAEFLRVQNRR